MKPQRPGQTVRAATTSTEERYRIARIELPDEATRRVVVIVLFLNELHDRVCTEHRIRSCGPWIHWFELQQREQHACRSIVSLSVGEPESFKYSAGFSDTTLNRLETHAASLRLKMLSTRRST